MTSLSPSIYRRGAFSNVSSIFFAWLHLLALCLPGYLWVQEAIAAEGTTELKSGKIYCGQVEEIASGYNVRHDALAWLAKDKADFVRDSPSLAKEYEQGIASISEDSIRKSGNFAFVRIARGSLHKDPSFGRFLVFVPEDFRPVNIGEFVAIQRPTTGPQLLPFIKEKLRINGADGESLWTSFLWLSTISDGACATATADPKETKQINDRLISSPDNREFKTFSSIFSQYSRISQTLKNLDAKVGGDWPTFCTTHYANRRYDRLSDCLNIYDEIHRSLPPENPNKQFLSILRANVALDMGHYRRAIDLAMPLRERKFMLTETLRVLTVAHALVGDLPKANEFVAELETAPAESNYSRGYKVAQLGQAFLATAAYTKALEALSSDWYKGRTNVWGTGMLLGLAALTIADKLYVPIPDGIKGAALNSLDGLLVGVGLAERPADEVAFERAFVTFHALIELGRYDDARRHYGEASRTWAKGSPSKQLKWALEYDLGRLNEAEGNIEAAVTFYQSAIDLIESSRRTINMEASRIGFVADKQAVYAKLISRLMRDKNWNKAFLYVERAKSRALVDLLAEKQDFANSNTVAPASEGYPSRHLVASGPNTIRREKTVGNEASRSQGGIEDEHLAALTGTAEISLERILGVISPNERIVNYYFSGKDLYALVAGKDSVRGFILDADGLETEVRRFRASLQAADDEAYVGQKALYKRLILPLADDISDKLVTVTPHGILHYLPFAALGEDNKLLLDTHALRMLPSASAMPYLRKDGPIKIGKVLSLGNPDLGRAELDLPKAQEEAFRVASLFPGSKVLTRQAATKDAFMELGNQFSIIHVAAHGEFAAETPMQSGVLLAKGQAEEGRLTVDDLYTLRLDNDLITLSACETGLGKITSGDDLIGLNRGFLFSGARSIVSSLWQVDDEATSELMVAFYKNLNQHSKREALRLAQSEIRKKYAHPFYWAAFQIVGNG